MFGLSFLNCFSLRLVTVGSPPLEGRGKGWGQLYWGKEI